MKPLRVNSFWAWHVKKDRKEAYRESRRELAWRARKLDGDLIKLWFSPEEVQTVVSNFDKFVAAWFDRSGNVQGVPEELCNRLCEGLTSTAGIEDLDREIERFRKFGKAGQTEIALRLHDNPMDALKIIGEKVVPALRWSGFSRDAFRQRDRQALAASGSSATATRRRPVAAEAAPTGRSYIRGRATRPAR